MAIKVLNALLAPNGPVLVKTLVKVMVSNTLAKVMDTHQALEKVVAQNIKNANARLAISGMTDKDALLTLVLVIYIANMDVEELTPAEENVKAALHINVIIILIANADLLDITIDYIAIGGVHQGKHAIKILELSEKNQHA